MAVTLYLFGQDEQVRDVILQGVSELIHHERDGTLSARIPARHAAKPGEYLGFTCIDGRFRMFTIDSAELEDETGETLIAATDAAIAELEDAVTASASGTGMTAAQAVQAVIGGTGFALGSTAAGRTAAVSVYYEATWAALKEIADSHNVRILPYFEFQNGAIVAKKIDIEERKGEYKGRIVERADGSTNITVTENGRPMTRVYATGAVTGTGDPPERVTLAGVTWSRANGDPADKPTGQAYIDNPATVGKKIRAMLYQDDNETDAAQLARKAFEALEARSAPEISGSATVKDLERAPGMAHKAIRIYDQVAVRAKNGPTAAETVIDVARDYVAPDLTKIEIGKEATAEERKKKSIRAQVQSAAASARRSGGRAAAAANSTIVNAALIQMNAEYIQANANAIDLNAQEIGLRATYEDLEDAENQIRNDVGAEIDAIEGELLLYARTSDLEEAEAKIRNDVGVELDALEASLTLYAKTSDLEEAEAKIRNDVGVELDALEASLTEYAKHTDLDGLETEVGERFDALEASLTLYAKTSDLDPVFLELDAQDQRITAQAGEIAVKANKVYVDAQITEVKTLIADEIEAELADLELAIAERVTTGNLIATTGFIGSLSITEGEVNPKTIPVVTNFTQALGEAATPVEHTLLTVA